MTTARSGETVLPTVSRTTRLRLTSWIWTYTTSAAIPTAAVTTPSHCEEYQVTKKSAWVISPCRRPACQILTARVVGL